MKSVLELNPENNEIIDTFISAKYLCYVFGGDYKHITSVIRYNSKLIQKNPFYYHRFKLLNGRLFVYNSALLDKKHDK